MDPTGHTSVEIFEPDGNREDDWKDIAGGNVGVGEYLAGKAPMQVTQGTTYLTS